MNWIQPQLNQALAKCNLETSGIKLSEARIVTEEIKDLEMEVILNDTSLLGVQTVGVYVFVLK